MPRGMTEMNHGYTELEIPAAEADALLDSGAAAGRWVLDPAGSHAFFHVRHFWGAITVHGSFGQLGGEATVSPDGTVTGRLTIDARTLSTRNRRRDAHLRSADFFDAANHPDVVLTVTGARQAGRAAIGFAGELSAAGRVRPVAFTAHIVEAAADGIALAAALSVDRTEFGMTWSPLRMAAATAHGAATLRFTREQA